GEKRFDELQLGLTVGDSGHGFIESVYRICGPVFPGGRGPVQRHQTSLANIRIRTLLEEKQRHGYLSSHRCDEQRSGSVRGGCRKSATSGQRLPSASSGVLFIFGGCTRL